MGYFVLAEKDSSKMQKCWKWITIGLLIIIVATCFTLSYVFGALQRNFNSNCMSSAILIFKHSPTTRPNGFPRIGKIDANRSIPVDHQTAKGNELFKEFNSYYQSEVENATDGSAELYQYLVNGPSIFRTTTERSNLSVEEKAFIALKDADFFRNYQIDEMNTLWGEQSTCDYFYYVPVFETIVAIVWIVFIGISGHRGEQVARALIHKAWRLVVPAMVCFAIMAIIGVAYAIVLNGRLNDFCNEFKSKFSNKELSCQLLIDRFSLDDDTAWSPGTNFVFCKFFAWLTVILWLLAVLIMLARCILGADFNIEEVENYTEEYSRDFDPADERLDTNSKVKFNDTVRRYSRERVYKPTTVETDDEK